MGRGGGNFPFFYFSPHPAYIQRKLIYVKGITLGLEDRPSAFPWVLFLLHHAI